MTPAAILLGLLCVLASAEGEERSVGTARLIIEEDCPDIGEADVRAFVRLEEALLEAKGFEILEPRRALQLSIQGLWAFLTVRSVDLASCHEKLVTHAMKISDYALRGGDHVRARLALQIANLFKLVGVRNWYRRIIHEADNLGIEMAGRRAPHLSLYTDVSYRLNQLHALLGVPKPKLLTSTQKESIQIVSLCIYPPGSVITDLALTNHLLYAKKHNYSYSMVTEVPPAFEYNPQFFKLQIVVDWIRSDSQHEWLMSVDCDAFFTNPAVKIADIVNTYAEEHSFLLIAEDNGGINSGVMLIRRSTAAEEFFVSAGRHAHMHMTWDQSMIFWELILRSSFFEHTQVEYPPKGVKLVHQSHLNAFHEGSARSWNTYAWTAGDFVKHFAGCPWEEQYCLGLMSDTVNAVGLKYVLNSEL